MAEKENEDLVSAPRKGSTSDKSILLDNKSNTTVKNKEKYTRDDSIYLDSRFSPEFPDDRICQSTPPIKAGWLEKKPPRGGPYFQPRWVLLDVEYLRYFQDEKHVYSKKMIPISSMVNILCTGSQKFEVVTQNRTFLFRAQSKSERNEWVSLLQDVVQENCISKRGTRESCSPTHMQGYLELRTVHAKLYVAVYEDSVTLYKNAEDFKLGIGVTSMQMNLGSVKDVDKKTFDLTTPYSVFSFVAESEQLKLAWVEALRLSISNALSSDAVVRKVWSQESNCVCADCGATRPEWASVNLFVVICSRCAGEHRRLGASVSKVKSLKLDKNVWTDDLIHVFLVLGNARANLFWAASVPPSEALCPLSSDQERRSFIYAKYRQGKYRYYHRLFGQQEALNRALCDNIKTNYILETLMLVFCGADVNCDTGQAEFPSPAALATSCNQHLQAEILNQNQNTEIPKLEQVQFADLASYPAVCISHSGNLHKTASTTRLITEWKPREEFSLRWCVLKSGNLSYGSSKKSFHTKQLKMEDIVCMSVNPCGTHGFKHTFEIYSKSERLFLFGDDDPDTVKEWIKSIVKSFLPYSVQCLGGLAFRRIGRLNYRAGVTQLNYREGWFALVGSTLHIHLTDCHEEEEIDLCRLQEIAVQQDQNRLVLVERGRTLFLESESKLDLQGWSSDIEQAAHTGGDTLAQQQLSSADVPIIVERCITFVTKFGLTSEGIYRRSGVFSKIAAILQSFQQDARKAHLREGEHQVDDVTGALKAFFRNLKEGLFTNRATWLSTIAINDKTQRIAQYQSLLSGLPPVNKATLGAVISHLYCVQSFANRNQMNCHNLAIVFGPTLFQTDGSNSDSGRVTEELIQHYTLIFNLNEQEFQKQMAEVKSIIKMQETLMNERKPEPLAEIICTVYLEDNGQRMEQRIKVCSSMSAAALTSEVLEQCRIESKERDYWSSYEVNHSEEMERPLHYLEKVLPFLSSGSTLVVKRNNSMESMLIYLASKVDMSKYGTVKVRGDRSFLSKSFQDRYVALSTAALSIYKEVRSNRPEKKWPAKSLVVYQGIKKKLNPPTSWGLTLVYYGDEEELRQWYLCCDTQAEMREWLAVFMNIQVGLP